MSFRFKADQTRFNQKMIALANVLKRPLRDVLESAGRVYALECARQSVPFGTGSDAKQSGEGAVERDIRRVYATLGRAYEDISPARMQGAFWRKIKEGNFSDAQRILDEFGRNLKGVTIRRAWDGGIAHRTNQDNSGKVRLVKPVVVMADERALERYIQREKGEVGKGKGAWIDVVRQLKGRVRGLRESGDITANWITRKGKGAGRAYSGGSDQNPNLRIENRVRSNKSVAYASNITDSGTINSARFIAQNRMIKNLQIAVKAETARLRRGG